MHEVKARTLSLYIEINDCVVAVPKGTVVRPPMRGEERRLRVNRRRSANLSSSALSNRKNSPMSRGGHRVVFARSRVLSRCHSGSTGVLKRDRDFPFFFVNFFSVVVLAATSAL